MSYQLSKNEQNNTINISNQDIAKDLTQNIIHKVVKQVKDNEENFKIFKKIIRNKSDIDRVIKQEKFKKSLDLKQKCVYTEPPIQPLKRKRSIDSQAELCKRAKNFVSEMGKKKESIFGRYHFLKRQQKRAHKILEDQKLLLLQKKKQKQKQKRRLKAMKNIELFKQKEKIMLKKEKKTQCSRNLFQFSQIRDKQFEKDDRLPFIVNKRSKTENYVRDQNNNLKIVKTTKNRIFHKNDIFSSAKSQIISKNKISDQQ